MRFTKSLTVHWTHYFHQFPQDCCTNPKIMRFHFLSQASTTCCLSWYLGLTLRIYAFVFSYPKWGLSMKVTDQQTIYLMSVFFLHPRQLSDLCLCSCSDLYVDLTDDQVSFKTNFGWVYLLSLSKTWTPCFWLAQLFLRNIILRNFLFFVIFGY